MDRKIKEKSTESSTTKEVDIEELLSSKKPSFLGWKSFVAFTTILILLVGTILFQFEPKVFEGLWASLSSVIEFKKPVSFFDKESLGKTHESSPTDQALQKRAWESGRVDYFSQMKEKKEELEAREARLQRREEGLREHEQEIERKIQSLRKMREEITSLLKKKKKFDEKKVGNLVSLYSRMQPQAAAQVIRSMDEDLAVSILSRMKKLKAAEVLNRLDAKKSQRLTEKFVEYKR